MMHHTPTDTHTQKNKSNADETSSCASSSPLSLKQIPKEKTPGGKNVPCAYIIDKPFVYHYQQRYIFPLHVGCEKKKVDEVA
jgi:hypothetical protein